jgi:hypothetical protein
MPSCGLRAVLRLKRAAAGVSRDALTGSARETYTALVIRRWVLSLLLVALPLQGLAVAWPASAPCPMEAEMAQMLASGDHAAADLPDCCNDADTFAKTGKACKSGQECGVASIALPATLLPQRAEPPAIVAVAWLMAPLPPDIVAFPWRPPASV